MTILWTVHWSHLRSWRISIPWSTRCGDWLHKQSWSFFPQTLCPHWGVLRVGVKGRGQIRVLLLVCGFWLLRLAQVRCPCAFTASARTRWAARFCLFRRCSFTSAPCFFFWAMAMSIFLGRGGTFGTNVVLRDRRRTSDTLSSAWQAWHFLHMAGQGQNERCFWRSCFVAGAVFGELGSRFVKLSSFLIWDMMMMPCGRCSASDASGPFVVAGAVLFRPRQKSSWDLGKTSFLFLILIFRGACNVLQTSNMSSRNPPVILARREFDIVAQLCVCRIALGVARCWLLLILWNPGRNILWVLSGRSLYDDLAEEFHGHLRGPWCMKILSRAL